MLKVRYSRPFTKNRLFFLSTSVGRREVKKGFVKLVVVDVVVGTLF